MLLRIGAADERALAELHARYGSVVFGFVAARTPDRGVAEEATADVWLGCWRSARAFRHDSRVLTWLLGIAKRQIYAYTRRKRLTQVPLDETEHAIPADDGDPADLVASAEETHALLAALGSLPSDLSEVVRLAWVHELPYEDIAELVGIPRGTVKSRVSRARRLLREELRRNDD
ncbi:RNA polymerase sigma factor [Georgenia deserti]|uniref:RNA polymerase sigma factor n=1 Tax=Georgenia deserti TaxID=2093781 RepID=A0ABW4L5Y1_9MICO